MLLGPEVVAEMRKVKDHTRSISKELLLDEWLTRSRGAAYWDNVMRLTAVLRSALSGRHPSRVRSSARPGRYLAGRGRRSGRDADGCCAR